MINIKDKLKRVVLAQFVSAILTFSWLFSYFWFIQDRVISRDTIDEFILYVVLSISITGIVFFYVNFIGVKLLSEREKFESIRKCECAIEELGKKKCLSRKKYQFLKKHVIKMKNGRFFCPVALYLLNAYNWLRPSKHYKK